MRQNARAATSADSSWRDANAASRSNATELLSNPAIAEKLEHMIANRLGVPVRHVRGEPVIRSQPDDPRAATFQRAYTKHWFELSRVPTGVCAPHIQLERPLAVFVKSSSKQRLYPKLELKLSSYSSPDFRVPYFYGTFTESELQIGAWEAIEADRLTFRKCPLDLQKRVVDGIAAINSVPIAVDGTVPVETKWLSVRSSFFRNKFESMEDDVRAHWRALYSGTLKIMHYQEVLSRRIREMGECFLAHNDIPGSFVGPDQGRLIFFDWELATLTVPGADLGFMLRKEEGSDDWLTYYLSKMAQHGHKLKEADVRMAMNVLQGFRLLRSGWQKEYLDDVQRGLRLLSPYAKSGSDGATLRARLDHSRAESSKKLAPGIKRLSFGRQEQLDGAVASRGEPMVGYRAIGGDGCLNRVGSSQRGFSIMSHSEGNVFKGNPGQFSGNAVPKIPSDELNRSIREHAEKKRGKLYAPVPHPAFSDIPYRYGPERFDMIKPHLDYRGGTVLDVGSNWGYTAHRLEELGYRVTAVEMRPRNIWFMTQIRDLCDKKFKIVHDSIFNLTDLDYDIVIAQNIFHHFLKTEETFVQFDSFLRRLKCRMMIYQAHSPSEKQMAGAYRSMTPEEMTQYLSARLSLPDVTYIDTHGKRQRKIFKLASRA